MACAVLALALLSGSGCTRPVLIPDDSPVRVGPDVTGRVYVMESGEWTLTDKAAQLPEGWYLVPPRFVNPGDFQEAQ